MGGVQNWETLRPAPGTSESFKVSGKEGKKKTGRRLASPVLEFPPE